MLIDIHCHLEMCEKPEEILEEARKKNLIIVSAGTNEKTNEKLLSWEHSNLKICLGLYPIDALKCGEDEIDQIINNITKNSVCIWGIGEVGIDYKESTQEEEHDRQKEIFRKFVQLSIELDKHIVVHSRKAEEDCIKILEEMKTKKVIMHCFSGNMKLVDRITKNGWFFSIPSNVAFSQHFQTVISKVPISQLLSETDSPYLHPEKSWPNTPLNVQSSYEKISEIKKLTMKEVEVAIEENYNNLS